MVNKESIVVSSAFKTPSCGQRPTIFHTCISESPVPGGEILRSDRTGDDEGEGKHYGEAQEQGEEEDCGTPVCQFGKPQDFLATLLLQLCCCRHCSRLCTVLSPLQWVALSGTACGLHGRLNASPAHRSTCRV